jgi:hypothetical protein
MSILLVTTGLELYVFVGWRIGAVKRAVNAVTGLRHADTSPH